MNLIILLVCICILQILIIGWFASKFIRERQHINEIRIILNDIKSGNSSRKILSYENDMLAKIGYDINEITSSYQLKLAEAETIKRSNQQLLASLSHDIKTPLTTLIGYLDALDSGLAEPNENQNYIAIAANKAQDLKNYVDMLFEWAKLDAKERLYHFVGIDINEFTRSLLVEWIPQFEAKGFEYGIDLEDQEIFAYLDESAYSRILENIIANTLHHSYGNKITISIHLELDKIQIKISDNGVGIPPDKTALIFDRLYKCDPSRSQHSSGLGLYITKELVHAMSGRIWAESIPKQITTFTVTFPKISAKTR